MMRRFLIIIFLISVPYAQDVVFWEPEIPVPGGVVTIYYNTIEGTLPDDTNPVYIHLGYNGWQNTNDYVMTPAPDVGNGWWSYEYSIPQVAEIIDFCFTDLMGNWDNNGGMGIDWHINLNYYWLPYNPGPNDSLTIVLNNVTQGGDIAWTVDAGSGHVLPIVEYWPDNSYIEEWTVFTPLEMQGGNTYSVQFAPFQNPQQVVYSLKFRIRWEDGSWDVGSNGQPLMYDIYFDYTIGSDDPYVYYLSPQDSSQLEGPISISADGDTSLVQFWANGSMIGEDNTPLYEATWNPGPNEFGDTRIIMKATGTNNRVSFVFLDIYLLFTINEEPVPSWAIDDGVNINGNEVVVTLYAPYKDYVSVRGNWNIQYPHGELMNRSGDTLWWYQTTLPDGDYHYKYEFCGLIGTVSYTKAMADPWSKNVHWKVPLTENESSNYHHALSVFEVGADVFPWTDDDFIIPPQDSVIVYEMHIGDFAGLSNEIGTYTEVMGKLEEGYFDTLGITAVELMPLNEFEGENSWGYNPTFYLAPESTYGTPEELKELVNAFHEHEIAVLLDVVFNHTWGSSPLFQLYQPEDNWDYEDHDYNSCPYYHNQASDWGYKLQHWHNASGREYRAWKYVLDALKTWVLDYHFDGFRFDHTQGIGWGGDVNGASFYAHELMQLNPDLDLILIAEEDNPSQINNSDFDAGWDYSYHHSLFDNLMEISLNMYDLQNHLQWWSQGWSPHTAGLNYIESHDEPRLIYEATHYQGMSLSEAYKKSKLGAVALLTGTGTPMLYHGQEFGQNGTSWSGGYIMPQPLQWDNLGTPEGQDLFEYYQRLIWLRKSWDVILGPNLEVTYLNNSQKVIAVKRNDDGLGQTVFAVMNFNNSDQTISNLAFPYAGDWFEFTMDDTLHTSDGNYTNYMIPASTARVYTNYKNWPDLGIDFQGNALPVKFSLEQNYPNPFNASTMIQYTLAKDGEISLVIYDINGREVSRLFSGYQKASKYEINWSPKEFSAGVYFCRLVQGNQSAVKKLIYLK